MKLPEIIGIAGTNGSGKDTLGQLRQDLQNTMFLSLSNVLRDEASRRGLSHLRQNLGMISTEWERELGKGALVTKAVQLYHDKKEENSYTGLSIVSVRRTNEAEKIKELGGVIVWVDADRHTRYERVQNVARGRVDDQVSFEEFCAREDAEMYADVGKNKGAMNMGEIKSMAEITIINDFSTKEEYVDYLIKQFELSAAKN